ncbi:MAG: hypothetical protein WC793_00890 [Candidatus Paceibacterota bacterium]|jgi:hypothetical protein
MNKKILSLFVLLVVVSGATKALASLTFSSAAITGDTASTIDVGAGNALSLQTTNGGNIITGSGNVGIGITPTNKLTVSGTSNFTGHVAMGTNALINSIQGTPYQSLLALDDTLSWSLDGAALTNYPNFDPAVNGLYLKGNLTWVTTPDTNNKNIISLEAGVFGVDNYGTGNITDLYGIESASYQEGTGSVTNLEGARTYTGNYEALTITNQAGVNSYIYNSKVGSTITNGYGLKITSVSSNSGTYTNTYGVYVGDMSIGTQTNYPFSFYASDANTYNYFAGNVGVGVTAPSQKFEVNGGVRLNTVTAKPTCDATVRGTFWSFQGGTGVKDTVEVCAKDVGDAYAWRTIY